MPETSTAATRHTSDRIVLAIACVAQFMVVLDVSIVNVALPAIRHDLGFSQPGLQWVLNAYVLTFAGFLLLGGRAADLFGRRRVFLVGLAVFTGASLLGALAQDQATLVAARAVQGFGGAVLSPATLTIITTTFAEGRARAKALGVWSALAGAGGAAGALLGGLLTQELSWRWIFLINVPIGMALFAAAGALLPELRRAAANRSLDIVGAALVTAGLTAIVYGLVRSSEVGWGAPASGGSMVLGAVLLGCFLVQEARLARAPIMPLRLLRIHSVWSANVVMLCVAGAIFPTWFFLSLFLQEILGFSPLRTGFAFLPQTLAIIVGAQVSSRIVSRTGPRPLLVTGPLISAAGLVWLSGIDAHATYWSDLFVPSVLVTLGMGLSFTPVAVAATSGVRQQEAGLASGLVNTARQVGAAFGLATLATVATDHTQAALAAVSRIARLADPAAVAAQAATSGFALAFRVSAAITVVAAGAALALPSRAALHRAAEKRAAGGAEPFETASRGAAPERVEPPAEPLAHAPERRQG